MFQFLAFLRFLRRATNAHGVHSPFVYDLVTKCFYNSKKYPEYKALDTYRKKLFSNNNSIEVIDLGAGSKTMKGRTRKIRDIARHAGSSKKRSQLLFRMTKYFQSNAILELGTSLGMATAAMQLGNPNAKIITLEGCPNTASIARNQFKAHGWEDISVKVGDFTENLPLMKSESFDLILFDGNHQKEATLEYFRQLLPTAHNDSLWIFDDIHWSRDMEEAWEVIKTHPAVSVTIDTFQWGLVFFRKEQAKEHFVIRI